MNRQFILDRAFRIVSTLAILLLLASCAGAPPHKVPALPALKDQAVIDIPDVDLLSLSPGMKEFVEQHSRADKRSRAKAWSLAYATMTPYVLDFEYDPHVTLPAAETFEARTGNCLSFSSMFVAMAREAGLRAYFQEVTIPPVWSNVNDNMLVSKHVNAVAYDRGKTYTVDVSRRVSSGYEETRRLSDREALAQHYNNLGVEALIKKDNALAFGYFRKALELDSQLDYIWSNLGVIYRRNGQTADATLAYETALKLEPEQAVALNNLYVIYTEDEVLEKAEELRKQVERNQRKNPYYIQNLALEAIEEQRYSDAIALAKQSLRIDSNEYRFHYTLAQAQFHAGKTAKAQASLDQALELAPGTKVRETLTLPGNGF